MAVEPAELRTFPLFPKLPFELRDQIWRESLPDKVTCSLCFYRDRCWTFERLTPSDKEYNHHIAEFVYDGQLRRKLLEEIELNLPHFFVNREARHNALTRMRAHDLKRRVARAGQSLVLARPFRLRRDALYIAPEMFGHFFFDSGDLGSEDEDKVPVLTARSAVTCIAATEESLSVGRHAGYLVSAMQQEGCDRLKVLYIIVNAQPELLYVDDVRKVQRQWELRSIQGASFWWDPKRGYFHCGSGREVRGGHQARILEKARKGFTQYGTFKHNLVEIRPAFAVGR